MSFLRPGVVKQHKTSNSCLRFQIRIVGVEIITHYYLSDVGFTNIVVQCWGQSGAKT